ncbi:MAG: hypothetical protein OXT72_11450 [Gammaproteobacteria bacterium]|nr:hypothetical protein [Gammaproteobacteria bacterium]MDE0246600.1 hypothetical protein [Gammaproteobacteria bacterium]
MGPWPVGEIPNRVLYSLGKQFVHRMAIGFGDIDGNDFGTIFANAVDGDHRASPLGLADVAANGTAWSVKTIKAKYPRTATTARLISGRCSPDYSLGISDPRKNPEATGRAVLAIWNARINESLDEYDRLRVAVLIRNFEAREFCLFEQPIELLPATEYRWQFNRNNNLEGFEKATGRHCFTWQPHGSQFTIKRTVPGSARYFTIKRQPELHGFEAVLKWVGYRDSWISVG